MEILDVVTYENMSFEEYLQIPALSFSFLKNSGMALAPTAKMRFGSLVDAFVFEPEKYNGEQYKLVKPVAKAVKNKLGSLLTHGKRQLAITCNMVHRGLFIPYKGRVDLFAGGIIIDMKVSELDIRKAIEHFGYHHQISGYGLPLHANVGVIVSVHPKSPHNIQTAPIRISQEYWEKKVLEYGRPVV